MSFKDYYNKYKILVFVVYAVVLAVLLVILKTWWIKLLFALPLFVLGGFILYEIFPRRGDGRITTVKSDGEGETQVVSSAVVRAVRNACKEISDIKYSGCTAAGSDEGLHIKLRIKIVNVKLLETSDLTREFIKDFVEGQLDVKIDKFDIIVINTTHNLKVKKITQDDRVRTERRAVYDENSPSYLMQYGTEKKVYRVPADYVEEEIEIDEEEIEKSFDGEEGHE